MKEAKFIWMNGKMVPWKDANVHVLTHALHYGTGVFEGVRCYNTDKGPAVFRLKDHVHRLVNSWRIFGEELAFSEDRIADAILETVKVNGLKACYIRPLIFLGAGKMGLNPIGVPAEMAIAAFEFPTYLGEEALENGVKVNVSSFVRMHPNSMMTKAKCTGNYINSVLAKRESIDDGLEEAVMLDVEGFVSECTGENIFVVRKGKLITPEGATILEGITRDSLTEIASDLGLTVSQERITRDELYSAEEIFLCGTAAEVTPVVEVDRRIVGTGKPGEVTKKLQQAYFDAVHGKTKKYLKWLSFVK
jgi:branched-chain amino acid aminotransferase